ncbi:unnamed protein product [Fraxinus pennsylvanica]|uniref:FAE domain-containing protein n=1 Tax=Fraxinus pennsylvanica TaxID=56036 RepID=A0AAD2DV02_9LAMI|nr:unnamed protein product [Fraxinus pennsylvanica]
MRQRESKIHLVRTHLGPKTGAYKCVIQDMDDDGNIGVSISRTILQVAGDALKTNLRALIRPFGATLYGANLESPKFFYFDEIYQFGNSITETGNLLRESVLDLLSVQGFLAAKLYSGMQLVDAPLPYLSLTPLVSTMRSNLVVTFYAMEKFRLQIAKSCQLCSP